ncbi:calcium-binding protein [Gemmobacter denitrificans]|uniref:Calcium-binding protein n=1 Tax=Gemmobacter denitrificans TaxID=3123040 RepID=A0ABU8BRL4_9RHOB
MTTTTLTGFQVTFSGSTATAVTSSTMTWVADERYNFRYDFDAAGTGFRSIAIEDGRGVIDYETRLGANRIDLNSVASVAEYQWGTTKESLILRIATSNPNVFHFFVLDGDPLPSFTSASVYNSFIASLTAVTSVPEDMERGHRPGQLISLHRVEAVTGTSENDAITGVNGTDDWSIKGVLAGEGNDTVNGLTGNDRLSGEEGNDSINGLAGNDRIEGGADADTLNGGDGNDTIDGGTHADVITGGNGEDRLNGGSGNDNLSGDAGNDTITGGLGNDNINGGADNDVLSGVNGNDTINGGTGNDNIKGGVGIDSLLGGDGNDTLHGGSSADTINGGNGNDILTGGSGADTFVFAAGFGNDLVRDFRNDADTLSFSSALAADVTAAMDAAVQDGRDVIFTFAGGEVLELRNTQKADLLDDITIV